MRSALHYNWARFQNIFLFSPTDAIQTYFGEEVGLYFAFITVYTIGRPTQPQGSTDPPGIHGPTSTPVGSRPNGMVKFEKFRIESNQDHKK